MKTLIIVIGALLTVGGAMAGVANDNIDEQVSKEYYEELYHNECMETYGSEFICKDVTTAEQNEELARKYSTPVSVSDGLPRECDHGKGLEKATKGFKEGSTMYIYKDGCVKFSN